MQNDQDREVLFVIIPSIIIFFALSSAIVFFMLYFQKKKFQYAKEKGEMEKQYGEQLLQSRLEMQEQTFEMISEEIHDNVGQLLSLAKLQLSILEQKETSDKSLITEIKGNLGNALTDLRDIAKSLNTSRIQELSLLQAVEQELQRIGRAGVIVCKVEVTGNEQQIAEQKKIIIFRIVQESLQNILKHAQATTIDVGFDFSEQLSITIEDNGVGFSAGEKEKLETGLGLQNIVKRATLIMGEATIDSVINNGTKITLTIPYV
ncbi:sensor histidine kinase [Pedobacter sp. MR2016-19]|uniref:sensor histidine kinase n=1 Tax=Pedobacter sp. MR2016-19 TaxID=2780089 RepID=UPI0018753F17|nr:sensor histidine kinase [Pedobacter sp. MR2016-19]MBE5321090.1 sensor histidine kinase [Pedobacter sp. MR2016-19]